MRDPEYAATYPNEGAPVVASRVVDALGLVHDEKGEFAQKAGSIVPDDESGRAAFTKKYAGWAKGLTDRERSAVEDYLWGAFELNAQLRSSGAPMERVHALDHAIESAKIPGDMMVIRAAPTDAFPEKAVGSVISDRAFVSTAIDSGWFEDFVDTVHDRAAEEEPGMEGGEPVQLLISVHKGQPGAAIDATQPGEEVGELTLPRDAQFRILSDQEEKAPIRNPSMSQYMRTIRLDYLGVGPHE
jgi:hypothetical protein